MSKIFLIVILALTVGACSTNSFYHQYLMRGQVVDINDGQVVICIGSEQGVAPGMAFDVYEVVFEGSMDDGTDSYRLEKVGVVELMSIVDSHFAKARVVSGSVERHNEIRLKD